MAEHSHSVLVQRNSDGGTVWWNSGRVMLEQCGGRVWWNSVVEQCGGRVEQCCGRVEQ